ncbi:hypothetical protein YPPY42_3194, partial [Yersinia pestis PY-42]
MFIST